MLRNLLSTLLCWALGLSPLLAQLQNAGARVEIQSGVFMVSTLDVQNTNGGTLKNAGTLVTTQSLSNNTGATLSGNGAYRVGINWTNSAIFTAGSSSVTFDGAQNSAATSGGSPFYNVRLNKSAGFHVALSDAMSIANTLDFQSGGNHLLLGNFNLSLGSVTGFGSDRYITTSGTGKVSKNVTTAFTFPVGFDKTAYNPLTLTQSGTPDVLSVRSLQNALANGATGAAFTQNTADVGWDVMEQTPGGSNLAMQFQWALGDELPLFNRASMSASRHDGANWQVAGAPGAGGGTNPYQFSAAGITAPGVFVLATQCFLTDGVPPSITCPGNLVRSTDAGQCSAVVTYASPTFSDNCTGASAALFSPAGAGSGTAFPKGSTSVVWQATDGAGLTKRCTFTVTVNDAQAPTTACPANQTRGTDANACTAAVTYATPTATDNCSPAPTLMWLSGGTSPTPSGSNSVSTFQKGVTTVTWQATDGVNLTKTCTFRVTINDTQAPTFTLCPSSQSINTDPNQCSAVATYTTPTASDNCAPPPTVVKTSGLASGSAFPKGANTVVWKATDGAGLTKTCSFTVTVTDAQLPSINCPGNIAVTGSGSSCSAVVTYANPTATDNCGIASNILLSGLASGSTFSQGVTTNVWRATDNSGVTQTCAFTVTVSCGTGSSEQGAVSREELAGSNGQLAVSSDHQLLAMNLAPNPAATQVQVTVEGLGEKGGELTVLDAQGRMVWQQQATGGQTRIELDDRWKSGVYMVVLHTDGQTVTKRLVVSRL